MFNEQFLSFNVLTKPDKNLFNIIQSNAKFKSLNDIIKTKVGINNFYNFSITLKSSILFRDIVLNSQFVSGWARSTQVLNDNDSKYASYKFLTKSEKETNTWINMMENFQNDNHSQDNMRSLIYLDSINDYAISIDILHILYLALVLNDIKNNVIDENIKKEVSFFLDNFNNLLLEYDIDFNNYSNMINDALRDFPVINASKEVKLNDITMENVYKINATYSVVGQIWRHRTLVKKYSFNNYTDELSAAKALTEHYNFDNINIHKDISNKIIELTLNANSFYDICQGSIIPFEFSGTTGAIYKMLCQRTCFINDSPQFQEAFNQFTNDFPNLRLLPPCKLNTTKTNNCYVGYVNESRLKGEELTQIPCPIWCKANEKFEAFEKSLEAEKTKWYLKEFNEWNNICKK